MTPTSGSVVRRVGSIVLVGLLTGALTQLGQSVLPDGWSQVANAISPWLLVAFLLGSRMPDARWAIVAGVGTLLFALVGYYGMIQLRYGYGGGTGSWIFWGLGAGVGGPVFGLAGQWWRGQIHRRRAVAIGLLAAVAVAEGGYLVSILPNPAVGAGFIVVGLAIPALFGRTGRDRLGGYLATLPALALGILGFVTFLRVNEWTAGL